MGFFSNILEKLGLGGGEEEEEKKAAPSAAPAKPTGRPNRDIPRRTKEMAMVDVTAKMDALAEKSDVDMDWRVSIVDLLKLLGIDSSYEARKELAAELKCPEDLMEDSAKMNTWLIKVVLRKIAKNGGNIPADLLD